MRRSGKPVVRAVFLDRDGTLLRHVHYLHKAEQAELLPGVAGALKTAMDNGARLFLFTNQSGVGQGFFSMADVEAVNRRMLQLIGLGYKLFTDICVAPEHPKARPKYRKPSPRFIIESLKRHEICGDEAVMVGDSPCDWKAGINAGVRTVAVRPCVFDAQAEKFRQQMGIASYDSLADWVAAEWPA